jgi:hypothetical protein
MPTRQSQTRPKLSKLFGTYETQITTKTKPTGWVAYCQPCEWSTKIFVTDDTGQDEWKADQALQAHKKTDTHKLRFFPRRDTPDFSNGA